MTSVGRTTASSLRAWTATALVLALYGGRPGPAGAQTAEVRASLDQAAHYDSLGRRAEAMRAYSDAASHFTPDTPDSLQRAVFMKLGRAEFVARSPQRAMVWFRRASQVGASGAPVPQRGVALLNLAAAAEAADQLDAADAAAREALHLFDQRRDTAMLAAAYNSAGMIRRKLGFPDEAARDFDDAVKYVRAAKNTRRESVIENNRGLLADDEAQDTRGERGRAAAQRAVTAYRASLALLEPADSADRAQTLNNLGVAFRRFVLSGGPRSFLDSADKAYADARSIQTSLSDRLGRARLEHNQALILRDRGSHDAAVSGLRQALADLRAANDEWWVAVTLRELADTYRGTGASGREAALAYYDSAATAFEQLSEHTGGDASRAAYEDQKGALSVYEHWALAALDTSTAGARSGGACSAFAIAERGRAQALRALMSGAAPRRDAPERANTAAPRDPCHVLGHPALAYYATADTLLVWLSDGRSAMRVARVPVGRDSLVALIGDVRQALGVEPDVATARAPATTSSGTRAGVGAMGAAQDAREQLARLAEVVLPAPLRRRLPARGELVVIPHGSLALVPFAALPISPSDSTPLGARLSLVYTPSAEVTRLAEALPSTRVRRGDQSALLVAGDPTMPPALDDAGRSVRLDPLPGARAEAISIASRLGVAPLVSEQATERAVRTRLPGAQVIHLASHGVAYSSDARAEDSFIALAPSPAGDAIADPSVDGHLTIRELLGDSTLALRAELVVLSACETALGRLRQSEGTLGLQRAFLARGARSVLVSLWRVDDAATRLLMERFYAYWLDRRMTKADALRLAQRDVRAAGYAAPQYWAAFQLVGAS